LLLAARQAALTLRAQGIARIEFVDHAEETDKVPFATMLANLGDVCQVSGVGLSET
jgi:hypothetical protein